MEILEAVKVKGIVKVQTFSVGIAECLGSDFVLYFRMPDLVGI